MTAAPVLGGGNGIGRSCCELLTTAGYPIVVADIDQSAAEATAALVRAAGGEATAIRTDATDLDSVANAIEETISRYATRSAVVHTVYGDSPAPVTDLAAEERDATVAVGLRSACARRSPWPEPRSRRCGRSGRDRAHRPPAHPAPGHRLPATGSRPPAPGHRPVGFRPTDRAGRADASSG